MPLLPRDRRTLAHRAATIDERSAALTASGAGSRGGAVAHDRLQRWASVFAPGAPDAFVRRLSWDGLDPETAAQLVSLDDSIATLLDDRWTLWVDALLAETPHVKLDIDSRRLAWGPSGDTPHEHPFPVFEELALRAARRRMQPQLPSALDGVIGPEVLPAFEQQLSREVGRFADAALYEWFRTCALPASDSGARYDRFVARLLDGGLVDFFLEYPVLARQLAGVLSAWVQSTTEVLTRFVHDRAGIVNALCVDSDPGCLIGVTPALSDPHHGRRRVVVLTFETGTRVVYKPRSVRTDAVFNDLLAWLNPELEHPLKCLRVLDCGTHGWVEFAAHSTFTRRSDVVAFFHRAGALMCLTSVLGARDLHRDNVVATFAGPVLVDLELLLQPDTVVSQTDHTQGGPSHFSCLSTGLLSLVDLTPDGEPHDAGALRGQCAGSLPFPRRVWRQVGTDDLRPHEETTFSTAGTHEVRIGMERQQPEAYAAALVAGFSQAYRVLLARREELLTPQGPPASLGACPVRLLPRPTNQYAMLAHLLGTPKYQRDGVVWSSAVDVLHRGYATSPVRPPLWAVAVEERRALLALDIPYFSARADGTAGYADGRFVADGFFTRSGLEAAQDRLKALSYVDLAAQLALLRRALSESVESKYEDLPNRSAEARGVGAGHHEADDDLLGAAEWVGRALVRRAERLTGGGLVWRYRPHVGGPAWRDHHLYDGGLGPTLFLLALAQATGQDEWRDAGRDALASILAHAARHPVSTMPLDEPIGGGNGLGSLVYGLTAAAALADEPECLAVAGDLAGAISARVTRDTPIDVVNGAAGAVLGLLPLYSATGDDRALEAAVRCGEHLVAASRRAGDGITWPTADGTSLLGYAHGVAGAAIALARLADATGDAEFARHASAAFTTLTRHRLQPGAAWPIAVTSDGQAAGGVMNGWCHGAPGVALAWLGATRYMSGNNVGGLELVLRGVAAWQPGQADHVCCGAFGRADILVTAGTLLRQPDAVEAGKATARRVIARARSRGHFRLSGAGTDYRVFDPGFFQGMSGIGYAILRTMDPGRFASVVAFDPPQATLRYCSSGTQSPVHRDRSQSASGAVSTECTS
jgi:type 2 lantibiotic biosynthesis protein LanM